MTTNRTTLAEIAGEANVAVSTVSKVLNGHTDVAAATRLRIERLLDQRGYRRAPAAIRAPRRTGLIDLVLDDPDGEHAPPVLAGVLEVADACGLGVIVSAGPRGPILPRGSEGAILVLPALDERHLAELHRRAIPHVLVDPAGQAPPDTPSIGATDFTGGYAATQHLITLGHRRIGMIGGPAGLPSARARTAGYRAALDAAGLPHDPALVRTGDLTRPGGLTGAEALLSLRHPPTALFAADDRQAGGAYEAARRAGRPVPDQLSVVGFGDLPFAAGLAPALTTVRQPLREMGVAATRTLLRLLNDERLDSVRIELATTLIPRASTAAPRRG